MFIKKEEALETFAVFFSVGVLLLLLISFYPLQELIDRNLFFRFPSLGTEGILISYILVWMILTIIITMAIYHRFSFLTFVLSATVSTFVFIVLGGTFLWIPFVLILNPLVIIPALYFSSVGLSFGIIRIFHISITPSKVWRYGGYIFAIPIFWFARYSTETGLEVTGMIFCTGCLLLVAALSALFFHFEIIPKRY